MAYKYGDRDQLSLFPKCIEDYVSLEDPVRAYDAFVDALDLAMLGVEVDENKVGNSNYNPRSMLKLLVYGYSYGWRSSRKLERAVNHNVSFMWLMSGLKPDHKTIAEFRRNNLIALKKVLKQCARLCVRLELIEGNTLFVDGTTIKANASRNMNLTRKTYEAKLTEIENRIEELLTECEQIDTDENSSESLVKMKKELCNKERLRNTIDEILTGFDNESAKNKSGRERTVNQTDPDSIIIKIAQGSCAGYNVQSVVDDKHGLIVNTEAAAITSDIQQFAPQIIKAEKVIGRECKMAVADAGYANTAVLEEIDKRGTTVIVPSQRQALHEKEKPFNKNCFKYDKENNCYHCPEGHVLKYASAELHRNKIYYRIEGSTCRSCKHFGVCTSCKTGRTITRLVNEQTKEKIERQYEDPDIQKIYARRKMNVELPFGHIKHNLGIRHFLLRGIKGAQAESAIGASCFNIRRMISIFGSVQGFISAIQN